MTNDEATAQVYGCFAEQLQQKGGPQVAIAHIPYAADTITADFTDALITISPTSLAAQLHEQGWQLATYQEIVVVLLFTASAEGGETAVWLSQQLPNIVLKTLGLPTALHLIWLTPNPAAAQLPQLAPFCGHHDIILLSQRNEEGLQLPSPAAQQQIASRFLWQFVTTPLRAQLDGNPIAETTITTFGLAASGWSWDVLEDQFLQRWLGAVFDQWTASAPARADDEANVATWVEQNRWQPEDIATDLAATYRPWPLPYYEVDFWQAPWPWQLADGFWALKTADSGDAEQLPAQMLLAQQGLDELLATSHKQLEVYLTADLDSNPIAAIDRNCRWLQTLSQQLTERYEQLLDQEAAFEERGAALADERGAVEAQMRQLLEQWPTANKMHSQLEIGRFWLAWFWIGLQPWRWPQLAWHYWQLRQHGQRLTHLLQQQAQLRREQVVATAVRHALLEREKQTRQWRSRVAEIGEMIAFLKKEVRGNRVQEAGLETSFLRDLYNEKMDKPANGARQAAQAIGGLGTQLTGLDDAILEVLRQTGLARLRWLRQLTAVDLLVRQYPSAEARQQWWQTVWHEATPLWPLDEAQIPESHRATAVQQAFVCGQDANPLLKLLGEKRPLIDVQPLETEEREQITLLRLRTGLPLSAFCEGERSN